MSGKPRVQRDQLMPVLADTSLASGEIARMFNYKVHWITQLRRRYGIKGTPRGGDRRSVAFKARAAG
jgi:hypothetical protein